jgi:type IX secretion system PorP/SprF family membrane protein
MKRILFFVLLAISIGLKAQESVFSRMSNTNLYLNPAFAGSETSTSFNVNHKVMWKSFGLPYTLSYASAIKPFFADEQAEMAWGGVGLNVIQEKFDAADYHSITANLSGAYNLIRNNADNSLQFGLQIGMTQRSIKSSSLQWGSQFERFNGFDKTFPADPIASSIATSKTIPEVNSGVIYSYKGHRHDIRTPGTDFTVGYSVYHLNRADQSFFKEVKSPTKFSHKSFIFINKSLPPYFYVSPGIISSIQGDRLYFQAGGDVRFLMNKTDFFLKPDQLMAGCWFQNNGFLSYMFGLRNDYWSIGFNYDMVLGSNKKTFGTSSGWEVFFRIEKKRVPVLTRIVNPDRAN